MEPPGQSILRVNFNSGKLFNESFCLLDVRNVPVGHKPNTCCLRSSIEFKNKNQILFVATSYFFEDNFTNWMMGSFHLTPTCSDFIIIWERLLPILSSPWVNLTQWNEAVISFCISVLIHVHIITHCAKNYEYRYQFIVMFYEYLNPNTYMSS